MPRASLSRRVNLTLSASAFLLVLGLVSQLLNVAPENSAKASMATGSTSGQITTVAGTGTAGFSGDSGPATSAQLNYPCGVTPPAI